MGNTGYFRAVLLGKEWKDWETLAQVCEKAELSNRQAQVILLHCRGMETPQVCRSLHIPRQEFWRSYRRAGHRLLKAYPRLRTLMESMRDADHNGARAMLRAYLNRRTFADHGPLMSADENGNVRSIGTSGMVTAHDFGHGLTAVDALPLLLLELAESGESRELSKVS